MGRVAGPRQTDRSKSACTGYRCTARHEIMIYPYSTWYAWRILTIHLHFCSSHLRNDPTHRGIHDGLARVYPEYQIVRTADARDLRGLLRDTAATMDDTWMPIAHRSLVAPTRLVTLSELELYVSARLPSGSGSCCPRAFPATDLAALA